MLFSSFSLTAGLSFSAVSSFNIFIGYISHCFSVVLTFFFISLSLLISHWRQPRIVGCRCRWPSLIMATPSHSSFFISHYFHIFFGFFHASLSFHWLTLSVCLLISFFRQYFLRLVISSSARSFLLRYASPAFSASVSGCRPVFQPVTAWYFSQLLTATPRCRRRQLFFSFRHASFIFASQADISRLYFSSFAFRRYDVFDSFRLLADMPYFFGFLHILLSSIFDIATAFLRCHIDRLLVFRCCLLLVFDYSQIFFVIIFTTSAIFISGHFELLLHYCFSRRQTASLPEFSFLRHWYFRFFSVFGFSRPP